MQMSMRWRRIVSSFRCCTAFDAIFSRLSSGMDTAFACTFLLDASGFPISCGAWASVPPTSCSSSGACWGNVGSPLPLLPSTTPFSKPQQSHADPQLFAHPRLTPKRRSAARLLNSPEPQRGPAASLLVGLASAGGAEEMVTSEGLRAADAIQVDSGVGGRLMDRIRQMYCGLHGHDTMLQFAQDRMFLRCV